MPIRTAIIGLSSSGNGWASSAHLPYLLSPQGKERYTIVAVCNSSKEAAKAAIERYQLPSQTKAYGEPEALAEDVDIDLVVCCTRVDKHYNTILPSIRAGKAIYLEWPLAHDFQRSQELVDAARISGSKTLAGLQGRFAPALEQVRNQIAKGRIGRVLRTEIRASGASNRPDVLPARLKYFTDWGIVLDQMQHAIGDIIDIHGYFQVQRPEIRIVDPATQNVTETVKTDVPDLVILQGQLQQAPDATDTSTLFARFSPGAPFPGEPAMVWHVVGERGELRLTAEATTTLQAQGYDKPVSIEIFNLDTNEVQAVGWTWSDWQTALPIPARSVGRLYEAFASGDTEGIPSFEDALHRHMRLGDMLSSGSKWLS
ncbi:NAD(P)-binding protein [Aspergillus cavernicola]|uniref:NAD(P)-binding protein n=1 Tax=Aspergillus cavernicola TaxID=176166 RepID=A0ABR4I621_9EURO